jgi:hypothetical protein
MGVAPVPQSAAAKLLTAPVDLLADVRPRGNSVVGINLGASSPPTQVHLADGLSGSFTERMHNAMAVAASSSMETLPLGDTTGAGGGSVASGEQRAATSRTSIAASAEGTGTSPASVAGVGGAGAGVMAGPRNSRLLRVHKQQSRSRCSSFSGGDAVRAICSVDDSPSHVASIQELKKVDLSQFTIRAPGSASINPFSLLPTADRASVSLSKRAFCRCCVCVFFFLFFFCLCFWQADSDTLLFLCVCLCVCEPVCVLVYFVYRSVYVFF